MPRKVILDMDPGVDDAIALCVALAEPQIELLAVTATGGNVAPKQATRNVQTIIEQVDPPRWPRIGAASADQLLRTDARHLMGVDGLCGVDFPVAELHNRHPSIKVLSDEIRGAAGEVTVVATGPLSNIATLLKAEPDLATEIGHLIILGGTHSGPGNITPAAEFNIYCDAESARQVFQSPVTKTLIPVDVSSEVMLELDVLERLKQSESRTARFLAKILPNAFRMQRQVLGLEALAVHDVVAVTAAVRPDLFTTEPLHGDVETAGELTHGATVFDRRNVTSARPNMDVAVELQVDGVLQYILGRLEAAP